MCLVHSDKKVKQGLKIIQYIFLIQTTTKNLAKSTVSKNFLTNRMKSPTEI